MLEAKSFIVTGQTLHKNGAYEKDIATKVDLAINSFLNGGKYVDLKIDTKITPQVGTDVAFITIIREVEDRKPEPMEDEPVFSKKKK